MNKYITALFVVLAATGVEAQTYQSALKAALENCSLEEIYHHVEQCGIETELLPIIEAFKNIQKEKKKTPTYSKANLLVCEDTTSKSVNDILTNYNKQTHIYLQNPSNNGTIIIRAPNMN